MSIFSTNRFKNLSAEYVEESLKLQEVSETSEETVEETVETTTEDDKVANESTEELNETSEEIESTNESIEEDDLEELNEAAYIDSLLEALDN